jgi:hypothetical protein
MHPATTQAQTTGPTTIANQMTSARLTSCLNDKQTIAMLYKLCALPSLTHFLPVYILINTDFAAKPSLTA